MATYTIRGTSHNVVYTYKAADGKRKQQWESYSSELEAIQRKAYIDYLQSQNRASDITHEASEYRRKKAVEKVAQKIAAENAVATPDTPSPESEDIKAIPRVSLGFLDNLPVVGDLFNNWCVTEWFAIVLIILLQFFFYKTVWGLRLRAVGQFPEAAKTAGIKVNAIKYQAMLLSGLIGGLAGAHLSLGYSTQFIENMTNNRGFMGVAAMYFGGANPVLTTLGCLLFGFSDSVGARLQAYGIPSQFVLMMPYIVTIAVLAISMIAKISANKKRESSLHVGS